MINFKTTAGHSVWINPAHIVSVRSSPQRGKGETIEFTIIDTSDGETYEVTDDPVTVVSLFNNQIPTVTIPDFGQAITHLQTHIDTLYLRLNNTRQTIDTMQHTIDALTGAQEV